ncbi:MAG: 50S ribosomal protein L16 [Candidatus Wildermuthbacteria bacterium RIFCSPHIGHO2_01_FULL_48_25]|uniref:Large ribosomal subunit protein uL16 n=1 Tax=Candidatus Wildermuthbacteria bacterium RIFCSPLOWO2_01_FULL_48_16 TaxID=1802461 RepID=A0A1G2RLW2_9BACT|nr:MAG: 50S ribosomal protein L16 [Candidatus Wildermuthbacteria bacterium RIFCSPHIGHO2_01_FULL_48_25]OHA69068.1 MAG: 50S ribosomal protein L16 [Candidatus Wildermuthbacteria bacterium RIFCSPHIGHO2_02_FULL_49_12b]OHA73478.1 MAG: 50S ribosomal protein L16 [Candidatus Wildermuthbacteria bacterium RIFCSPLOWO2_01_FULL_48_16]
MLTPRRVKFRKWHRGRTKGVDNRANQLAFGSYGLKAMDTKWVTARQIEAARRSIIRFLRKGGKVWLRVFPDKPVTSKGPETPMGGGKGAVSHYVFPMRPGRIIFEVEGIPEEQALDALGQAGSKLPIKTKIVKRV